MNPGTATVFVVGDDASYLCSITRLLRASGFAVAGFPSAEAFLADGKQPLFDCLVLDIRLPGMSGLELRRRLVAVNNRTPVVFITAHDEPGPCDRRPWAAGASGTSSRPIRIAGPRCDRAGHDRQNVRRPWQCLIHSMTPMAGPARLTPRDARHTASRERHSMQGAVRKLPQRAVDARHGQVLLSTSPCDPSALVNSASHMVRAVMALLLFRARSRMEPAAE